MVERIRSEYPPEPANPLPWVRTARARRGKGLLDENDFYASATIRVGRVRDVWHNLTVPYTATRGPGRPPAAKAAETRERIVRAAREVFSELGYDAATFQAIAIRADLTRPAINHYFASKRVLYGEVVDKTNEMVVAAGMAKAEVRDVASEAAVRLLLGRDAGRFPRPVGRCVPGHVGAGVAAAPRAEPRRAQLAQDVPRLRDLGDHRRHRAWRAHHGDRRSDARRDADRGDVGDGLLRRLRRWTRRAGRHRGEAGAASSEQTCGRSPSNSATREGARDPIRHEPAERDLAHIAT